MKAGPKGDPYLDFSGLTRDQAAALAEVTVDEYVSGRGDDAREVKRTKFKLADKHAALVSLGRHLGIFVDKQELTGPGGAPIAHEVTMTPADAYRRLKDDEG
jgi:phage terminase small subunit